ncbi:MAG: ATP phosphoribosyltransferase [Candidatus Argoarchaeum ethanivorans]|uniref:ATP phosphoribosyltransferase n=1 Tax=Candidatus Argoarchaeum ethanivorans TaxID=2608793 RepID=A0A811TEM4_9EURY|nr:MAG: ATP phosphoribosyltransferase [Candidatus Argoarchaeum ethanivorans]
MLNLVLPKGSLEEQTLMLFKQADLEIKKTARDYNPTIDDPRVDKIKILRPQEIPKYIEEGYFDIGISGRDWVVESNSDVVEVADLPYSKRGSGKVKIVVATPIEKHINSAGDIKPYSRVATEYPNITRAYFDKLGIPVKTYFSYGATEAKVPEIMDIIIDVTETGSTLRRNGLKIIDVIMESNSKLLANKECWKDAEKRRAIEQLKTLLLSVIEARGKVLLDMNVIEDKLEDLIQILPALKKPTISKLYQSDYYAIETVVSKSEVNILIPMLKEKGAEDILELNISKIVH